MEGDDAMNEITMFAACAFALLAAYVLHGGWLAHRWGVDPGRKTPAALGLPGGKRRRSGGASALVSMASCLWMALCLYLYVWDLNPYKLPMGILAVVLCALACAALSFAALFVSVRTGDDLAQAAGQELFPAAKDALYILAALTALVLSGIIAALLTGNLKEYMMPAYGAIGWLSLSVMGASQRIAPVIGSEQHMKPAAYGSAVCVGVITLAICMAAEKTDFVESSWWTAAAIAIILIAFVYPACLAGDALRGLFKSPLPKKKRAPDWIWTPVCLAASAALGLLCGEWLLLCAVVSGSAYVLLAMATCTKWFYRIGRGLFSRN